MTRETCFKRPITMCGDGITYNKVFVTASGLKAPGISPATYVNYGLDGAYEFENNKNQVASLSIFIPDDMDRTTTPSFGLGWSCPQTSGNVKWQVEHLWIAPDEDTNNTTPDATYPFLQVVSTTSKGYKYFYVDLTQPSVTDRSVVIRLTRLGSDVQDTAEDSVYLFAIALKYKMNKVGSVT